MNATSNWLDNFVRSRAAQVAAFLWGLAEATVFFVVPDVFLTLLACRSRRASMKACGWALCGALLGGIVMYNAARNNPEDTRAMLTRVPAIDDRLIQRVQIQESEHGLLAVLIGPTVGIPYKIYAVEWAMRAGNLPAFLLVSVPARGIRFLFSSLMAAGIAGLIAPWTRRRPRIETTILAVWWIGFYAFYFSHFGW